MEDPLTGLPVSSMVFIPCKMQANILTALAQENLRPVPVQSVQSIILNARTALAQA